MKRIRVVAAIISNQQGEILATQRNYGEFKGGWEFPGGKIETNETAEVALTREIREELNVFIAIDSFLCTVEYDYPTFHITMHCYLTHIESGRLTLSVHQDARWLSINDLSSLQWLPADIPVIEHLKNHTKKIAFHYNYDISF